jgi:iron(III) transport system ATP-binding protein
VLEIRLENVSKSFPPAGGGDKSVLAVDDVSCTIARGEIFFLLGPSGCGKTTLLRILAGFVQPTGGRVFFDGLDVTNMPPERRQLAMVFQSYALWPHMTVAANVAFGPRTSGRPRREQRRIVQEMLAMVGMLDRRGHKPPQLSGGQQQRVALARALAVSPRGLLLDEPLSNLDARLRERMRGEIRRLVRQAGATAVYVTHDQEEALSMADRIAVMDLGRIVQVGTPREVYRLPASRFVADFLGEANFFSGKLAGREGQDAIVDTPVGRLRGRTRQAMTAWGGVTCCIRPESVRLVAAGAGASAECPLAYNRLRARCEEATYMGSSIRYRLRLDGGQPLRALVSGAAADMGIETGAQVEASFAPENVVVLES